MNTYKGYEINCGFLTGNFCDEIDVAKTVEKFQKALEEMFLGATINVNFQHASGCKPATLKTSVYINGELPENYQEEDAIIRDVDYLIGNLEPIYTDDTTDTW